MKVQARKINFHCNMPLKDFVGVCWCALDSHICNDKTPRYIHSKVYRVIKVEKTKSWHHQIHSDFQEITVNHLTNRPKPRVCRRWYSSWFSSLRGKSLLSLLPVKRFWSPRRGRVWKGPFFGTGCRPLQFVTCKQLSYWNTLVSVRKQLMQPTQPKSMQRVWPMPQWGGISIKKSSSQSITEVECIHIYMYTNTYLYMHILLYIYVCICVYIYVNNLQWYHIQSIYISLSAPYHLS